jgi:DNA-binding MarR family transcriptional regulator
VSGLTNFENPTVQKLLKSLTDFKRNNWHERTINGLKPSEIKVIFAIKRGLIEGKNDLKISDISKRLSVTSPTVTQIMNDLEKEGLVIREIDPNDRRAVKIRLTEKGEGIAIKAEKGFTDTLTGLIDHLGEEDSQKLAELLSKAFEYLKSQSEKK